MRIQITLKGSKIVKVLSGGADSSLVDIAFDCPFEPPKEGSDIMDNLHILGPLLGIPLSAEDIEGFVRLASDCPSDPDEAQTWLAGLLEP